LTSSPSITFDRGTRRVTFSTINPEPSLVLPRRHDYDGVMIRGRRCGGVGGSLRVLLIFILLCLGFDVTRADELVDLPEGVNTIDLSVHGTRVAAQRRNLQLEVPGETDGTRAVLELHGQGPGPEFNWTIFTFRNASAEKHAYVLAVDLQRFAASGVVNLQPFGSQLTSVQWLANQIEHAQQTSATADAFRFELNPGQSITLGLEGRTVLSGARIFDVSTFAQREASLAFLRGAVLAVAFVLSLSILSLYGIRANRVFLVGGFFAFSALLFMALEAGYLDKLSFTQGNVVLTLQHARAIIESLFALGLGLLFWGLTNLYRRSLRAELPYLFLLLGLVALVGFSVFMPDYAGKTARWAVLALAIAGFVAAVLSKRNGVEVMDNATLFWAALLLWVFLATVAAVGDSQSPVWHASILAVLTAVVSILAFVSLRLAFAQGFLSKPYLQDSSRRSLALTGAQHFLWDWQPQENTLDVGVDLARSLGHAAEKLKATAASRWFAALLHPADELAYRKCLDLRNQKAGNFIEQELRLRNSDGIYHWFSLRARALPGAGGVPARLIGTLTDITRNKQAEDRLINESIHDPVTGLPSRALFVDRVQQEISRPLALPRRILMIGIERFKILNEGLGPDLGDQLLMAAGQRISACVTSDESVARMSGSSFAVMHVESIDGVDAETLAADILAKLAAPIHVLAQDVYLSASIGISLSSINAASAAVLQQQAETALHEAQAQGPRNIATFHDDLTDERAEKVALETDLRRAIERHEIEVHYQPIMHLHTRDVAGLEALARWRHPVRGMLQPSEFIGMAEQAGMIRQIGDMVLSEAIRQMGIWQRVLTRNKPVFMSINVSADQLSDTGFMDRLNSLIAREGVLPHAIKIEITESVVMRFPERARNLIQRLRNLGIGVACDDFGTGFSNLAGLRELAFDTLKMDRSFITGDGLQGRGGVILQSVLGMAHSLGMIVVAEGIEKEEQVQQLLMLGCELGQGFALGQPMAARDIHGLLAVLPVVIAPVLKPYVPTEAPGVGEAPMAPRDSFDNQFGEDLEPEELPSIFSVYNPKIEKPKTNAKKKVAITKAKTNSNPKSKSKSKSKPPTRPPASQKKMATRKK
jgi:diguanylate cyclase (GGDEF)-like protein/PAS domain S-box-containing protein